MAQTLQAGTKQGFRSPKSVRELKWAHEAHESDTGHQMHLEIQLVTKNTFLQYEGPDMVRASGSSAK